MLTLYEKYINNSNNPARNVVLLVSGIDKYELLKGPLWEPVVSVPCRIDTPYHYCVMQVGSIL